MKTNAALINIRFYTCLILLHLFIFSNVLFAKDETPKSIEKLTNPSYLFIGDSKTYFNNMPQMFEKITKNDKDNQVKSVNVQTITWGTSTLSMHAQRIAAIAALNKEDKKKNHVKGIIFSNLTNEQKRLFDTYTAKASSDKAREERFKVYVNALYIEPYDKKASKKTPRVFDAVVIQEQTANAMDEKTYMQGAKNLVKELKEGGFLGEDSKKIDIVVNSVWPAYNKTSPFNLKNLKSDQAKIDKNSKIVAETLAATYYKKANEVKIAYTGNAFMDFLTKYNSFEELNLGKVKKPAAALNVYKYSYTNRSKEKGEWKLLKPDNKNPIYLNDYTHCTPVGSLLEAATIYNTVYYKVDNNGAKGNTYRGGVNTNTYDLRTFIEPAEAPISNSNQKSKKGPNGAWPGKNTSLSSEAVKAVYDVALYSYRQKNNLKNTQKNNVK